MRSLNDQIIERTPCTIERNMTDSCSLFFLHFSIVMRSDIFGLTAHLGVVNGLSTFVGCIQDVINTS